MSKQKRITHIPRQVKRFENNQPILKFSGKYSFLSNFYYSPIVLNFGTFSTVEHYFQSAKTQDMNWFHRIACSKTPEIAKNLGRKCPLRKDWDQVKDSFMMKGVRYKFTQNEDLKQKLIDTGKVLLVEGTEWADSYWGYDSNYGYGQNRLGQILMIIRLWCREGKI